MNYKIEITSYFKKQAKRLLKKYPSLKNELSDVISTWKPIHKVERVWEMAVSK